MLAYFVSIVGSFSLHFFRLRNYSPQKSRFVPGIRPGARTAEYIDYVLIRYM
jgi:hypothetical protein